MGHNLGVPGAIGPVILGNIIMPFSIVTKFYEDPIKKVSTQRADNLATRLSARQPQVFTKYIPFFKQAYETVVIWKIVDQGSITRKINFIFSGRETCNFRVKCSTEKRLK